MEASEVILIYFEKSKGWLYPITYKSAEFKNVKAIKIKNSVFANLSGHETPESKNAKIVKASVGEEIIHFHISDSKIKKNTPINPGDMLLKDMILPKCYYVLDPKTFNKTYKLIEGNRYVLKKK